MNLQRLKQHLARHRLLDEASGNEGDGGGGGGGGEGTSAAGGEGAGASGNEGGEGGEGEGGEGAKKPKLSDSEAKLLKENMRQKEHLRKLNEKLAAFEGIDPSRVKELLDAQKAAEDAKRAQEEADLVAKGQFETIKKQMVEQHGTELKNRDKAIGELQETVSKKDAVISDLTVGNAFGTSDFVRGDLHIGARKARQLYGSHFAYEDGQVVGYDKPAGAKDRAPLVDAQGQPLSFDKALKKIIDADPDKDTVLKSKVKEGAGSSTTNTTTQAKGSDVVTGLTSGYDKIKAGLAKKSA